MALPFFPVFVDVLDPQKNGLYSSFSSPVGQKVPSLVEVRNKGLYLAVCAMQQNSAGTTPWLNIDLTTATVRVTIDNADLFPTQGGFYLISGSTSAALASNIGQTNVQNALNGLTTISGAGGLTVTQVGPDFVCTWNNNGAQPLITSSPGSLYPASQITVTETQAGTSSLPEIQVISIRQLPATLQGTFTVTSYTGYTAAQGELQLNTPGMLARFDSLGASVTSFAAVLQVDVQFPGQDPQTILQVPVTVNRDVLQSGISSLPPYFITGYVESWFQTITGLSSGAGTLSALGTAGGQSKLGRAGFFFNVGITQGWTLVAYTSQSGPGFQQPNDFNASTNPVIWQQFS
jgi:hypothetical protein